MFARVAASASLNCLLALHICLTPAAADDVPDTCYLPDGSEVDEDWEPCDRSTAFSACCKKGDICLTNGLCRPPEKNGFNDYWRDGCTDKTWQSDACPKYCLQSQDTAAFVLACDLGKYCCGTVKNWDEKDDRYCCDDSSLNFTGPPVEWLSGPKQDTLPFAIGSPELIQIGSDAVDSTTATASISLASSSSAAATGTNAPTPLAQDQEGNSNSESNDSNDSGGGLSTGASAGIGVAVALAIIAAVGILAWILFRRRRQRRQSPSHHQQQAYEPVPGGQRAMEESYYGRPQQVELNSEHAVHEMGAQRDPVELPGKGPVQFSTTGAADG